MADEAGSARHQDFHCALLGPIFFDSAVPRTISASASFLEEAG
jgi:hypothetical protein